MNADEANIYLRSSAFICGSNLSSNEFRREHIRLRPIEPAVVGVSRALIERHAERPGAG
jgi:hypothetical protein